MTTPLENGFTDATPMTATHPGHHNDVATAINAIRQGTGAAGPTFDITAGYPPSTTPPAVPGDLNYTIATAGDVAYALDLLLQNFRTLVNELAAAGIVKKVP